MELGFKTHNIVPEIVPNCFAVKIYIGFKYQPTFSTVQPLQIRIHAPMHTHTHTHTHATDILKKTQSLNLSQINVQKAETKIH